MHALTPSDNAHRDLSDDSGFVLLTAILVMAALLVLVISITAAATHVNHATTRTAQTNQALAAANAGLQAAIFELDNAGLTAANTSSNNTALGNGASYTTSVSQLTATTSPCTGLWVQNSAQTVNQDCVTSVGTQGGVTERVQARVVGFPATTSLFPVNGVFAINGFTGSGNVAGNFSLGSNGQMTFNNSVSLKGNVYYPPTMPVSQTNNACSSSNGCVLTPNASAITVPSVAASQYTAAMTNNNDANVPWPTTSITYTASSETVTVANTNSSQSITINLPGGTTASPDVYYFCNVNVQGANAVTFNAEGPVKIFIDNNNDSGHCTAAGSNSGNFIGANSLSVTDGTPGGPNASDIQMFFYGQPGCTTSCPNELTPNSTNFTADIFAPNSSATPAGSVTLTGAWVIGTLNANSAFTFNYQVAASGSSSASGNTVFYPSAQSTCVGTSITSSTC